MFSKILKSIFGTKNDRELKRMYKVVAKVNTFEEEYEKLSDSDIKEKTQSFKTRIEQGETLDHILPEAFALVREASKRVMNMRHFDVQLIGGMTLHEGRIAEMRTGEGKTLVATLAAYLNALSGKGVHVVTVNDYLARRDANWMKPLYEALGMTVGSVVSMQDPDEKKAAYLADITYGTNNEFGFDYLRDNMVLRKEDRSQRPLNFAIVDEVDSILIDEARTPLIISGAAEDSSEMYRVMNKLVPKLKKQEEEGEAGGHFTVDEKTRQVELTEDGHQLIEELLTKEGLLGENDSLYGAEKLSLLHHIHSALKAYNLFNKNVEYIVQNDQVVLIDEHTGRTMPGRRLSEGLHQALEAKEGVVIQSESQTLASTTFQNYFRLFPKLAGMTGTADTEAFEFNHIYGLDVVVIPTNKPTARLDLNDLIFMTVEEKYEAIIRDINEFRGKNAPVLVGTASVETSEEMSKRLKKAGIKHEVLNAKYHEREADIIAQAGRPGAVTIATNMAGRGTDIVLGGKWESEIAELENPTDEQIAKIKEEWQKRHDLVIEAGGLHIIGTERHESRRIDNQLRGRAGRQGDPGLSRFYLSLEDNLMRIFASDRVRNFMQAMGMEKGEAIEHRMVTNAIEKAQRKVEGRNFDYRKQILEYDDVANDQRRVIYAQRNELLEAETIDEAVAGIREDVISNVIDGYIPPQSVAEQWNTDGLEKALQNEFGLEIPVTKWLEEDERLYEEPLREKIMAAMNEAYQTKADRIGDVIRVIEKQVMLQVLDSLWKEHLQNMDHMRQGIGLRAYAQRNPKQEYKRESFELFQRLLENLKHDLTRILFRIEPMTREEVDAIEQRRREQAERQKMDLQHQQVNALQDSDEPQPTAEKPFVREGKKVGRNDPCPCGSGKKFKACHGKLN
ncbi:preprotein translocase subunit SecA [Teredinibacter sp. KSP-S5-2]|uniref:preprotein translocase subunit SecA n=1 Tax=Teredinibacter sp. KSP-S5-2 TaxID=3034506 RepID=UPI00293519A2|nr:preprotein translocase subunit SecA [Teredinibacter sp. KSP-S5-2]WNO09626.1 preprotein translocase subunit SecA [Teredinibacter sp. KSP-S5-2]